MFLFSQATSHTRSSMGPKLHLPNVAWPGTAPRQRWRRPRAQIWGLSEGSGFLTNKRSRSQAEDYRASSVLSVVSGSGGPLQHQQFLYTLAAALYQCQMAETPDGSEVHLPFRSGICGSQLVQPNAWCSLAPHCHQPHAGNTDTCCAGGSCQHRQTNSMEAWPQRQVVGSRVSDGQRKLNQFASQSEELEWRPGRSLPSAETGESECFTPCGEVWHSVGHADHPFFAAQPQQRIVDS